MNEQALREILRVGHEAPGIEFKGPGVKSDKKFFSKVVKACLGMANRRGGGAVFIGVEESDNNIIPRGLQPDQLTTWSFDNISGTLNAYADPFIEFTVNHVQLDGITIVVIKIEEFESLPILCDKGYENILRKGACYVRRSGHIETSEIPTQAEMRALLDLAIEKGVRRFVQKAHRAGIGVSVGNNITDEDKFKKQIKQFDGAIIEKIKSRGYWHMVIRPKSFKKEREPVITQMFEIISGCSTDLRGWDFPHINRNEEPIIGEDWIEQFTEWDLHIETWRLYQSGLLVFYSGFRSDWREKSSAGMDLPSHSDRVIGIYEVIYRFTALFNFAAALSMTNLGDSIINIQATLKDLVERRLWMENPRRTSYREYRASVEKYTYHVELKRDFLISETETETLKGAKEVFRRFGYDPADGIIEGILTEK